MDEVAGKTQDINCFEYQYTYKDKKTGSQREASFEWITDIEVNERNIEELIKTGRGRWKIENEGYNNQKNGIYRIVHLNGRNTNAMKNHYLLTQTADILMQIYLAWNQLVKKIKQSIKIHLQGYWKVFADKQ